MYDLLIKGVRRLTDSESIDIGIKQDRIVAIGSISDSALKTIDGKGRVVLPPYVESHIHLDTALTCGFPAFNQSGELFEGIKLWNEYRQTMTEKEVTSRALDVIRTMAGQGVLFMRSMVDVSDPNLIALKALLQVKKQVAPFMALQLVAFPQSGLSSQAGREQLDQAIALGIDGISAVPHLEPTREKGVASLVYCFQRAQESNCFLHIFCDEIDDLQSRYLEVVADLAYESGLKERVTVSHLNAMSYYNEAYVRKVISLVKRAEINVVTAPLISSVMQGRLDSWPKGRGITRVKDLHEAGVPVAIAHDDFLSPFYPLGTGSLLNACHMLIHLAHMTGLDDFQDVFEMITSTPAKILNIDNYGIKKGCLANLLLVTASDAHDLIRRQPVAEVVISQGHIIAETPLQQTVLHVADTLKLNDEKLDFV
ncbi:amidohydrolase family protein [Halalkalibacter krulwichiae]|uniref:Cytosine deaminase n=1 Tax=Halalkalibacter krulwichiae TaxID=199441 RepID=A0A1X9MF03_9BACI|nr:amidohydrolase family protein [Halalkalibacter krulwichiae]ARK32018.1 Cytosine deaminase [Halalkalibacter krulwichiae]